MKNEEEILEQTEISSPDYFIGQIFWGTYPASAADWCADNNAFIEEIEPVIENDISIRRFEIKAIIISEPTPEQQRENRAIAYERYVDQITAHIERLKDEEQTDEIVAKINELKQERSQKVQEIKNKYPKG